MKNVVFAGVGGQGVILASKVLMEVAKEAGYDVKESEIHGMAQRGGSVDCHVRYGKKVYSPLIEKRGADYIVSFEQLEAMRKLDLLAPEGTMIINLEKVDPAPVMTGEKKYPDDIEQWVSTNIPSYQLVDTAAVLKEVGTKKALNIVMLGVLSKYLEFTTEQWEKAIKSLVKEKFLEMNIDAFNRGRAL
ncbi:MAG TPA: indolepyruvate oxidoreductase subunit beta [Spirochaetota bacterium]|nr:indolepyruvate oxidoreductase subunit beta [Spirochaetota bacterium]HPI88772.1 indolepyruvate oxidoreductase subunit beta [Spirochaetota bacterium]HPR47153.1 indolepyruvate oxidoreductase subunit beta [Spirochaetota bacterium]